jgi:hypothetical protein
VALNPGVNCPALVVGQSFGVRYYAVKQQRQQHRLSNLQVFNQYDKSNTNNKNIIKDHVYGHHIVVSLRAYPPSPVWLRTVSPVHKSTATLHKIKLCRR